VADSANPVRDFAGTESGEWAIVNGDFGVVAGAAAVPQGIRVRVKTILGEIFLDESLGVDYLGKILVKAPDPLEVRAEIGEQILSTPDVTDAMGTSLVGPDAERQATISYQVATIYSQSPISGTVSSP
jgi:hypothetical protein